MHLNTQLDDMKITVLNNICSSKPWINYGRSKYKIENYIIHVRATSPNQKQIYRFNINPNTLNSDYEVLICGSSRIFYLLPISMLKKIYNDPNTYPDRHHEEIRIVGLDVFNNILQFAHNKKVDITHYLRKTL